MSDQGKLAPQVFVQAILDGHLFKIPASTQAGAESIRQSVIDLVISLTTEPIEAFIMGKPPRLEVWVRKLVGGRPTVWACGCGFMGSEQEVNEHTCDSKK